jgi:hypothetical protein
MDSNFMEHMDKQDKAKSESAEAVQRRELVRKLGRFAVYAAPFTILALTPKKASASAVGKFPGKH